MKRLSLLIGMALLVSTTAFSVEIGGVQMPETLKAGETTLVLNGAGLRKKLWIKVYAGGLYLEKKTKKQKTIIDADAPMAVRMHFIYNGVSAKKLIDAWDEGFEAATGDNIDPIKAEIAQFNGMFTKEAMRNDVYDIIYVPEVGTTVSLNGKPLGTVKSLEFKKALFAIWLGDKPADDGLKEGMLSE